MLRALKPEGFAIFQVPTYSIGYGFSISEWITADHALDMQMHCLPQQVIFSIMADEKCVPLEVREDNSTGAPNRFISNTFVVHKTSSASSAGTPIGLGARVLRRIALIRQAGR